VPNLDNRIEFKRNLLQLYSFRQPIMKQLYELSYEDLLCCVLLLATAVVCTLEKVISVYSGKSVYRGSPVYLQL
jgi:hypothetical protein